MPGIDAAETLAVPIWLAGAAAVAFVVAILLAVKRAGGVALITSLFRICLAVVLGAWLYGGSRDTSERRALDDRKMVLMAGSIAPGSALSCLDELAGEAVENACEKGVFASPEAVAAAVKYVTAQLALIEDGTAYAKHDASYAAELAPLRTAVELDRFGLIAQVLKERDVIALEVMHHAPHPREAFAKPQIISGIVLWGFTLRPIPIAAVLDIDNVNRVVVDDAVFILKAQVVHATDALLEHLRSHYRRAD